MRIAGRSVLGGLLAAASLSWCADGAMAGARWYPPSYDDEGYSPPAGYLPPPVSYYQYAPRRPVVVYDPPVTVWVPPPMSVRCGRRQRCYFPSAW